jgi:hypothetical protein
MLSHKQANGDKNCRGKIRPGRGKVKESRAELTTVAVSQLNACDQAPPLLVAALALTPAVNGLFPSSSLGGGESRLEYMLS